ncbi:MAG: phosphoenolpyruvate carboxylase, partial [Chloroflexota bacterium]
VLAARLADDTAQLPAVMDELRRRFPLEPYRCRFGAIAERLRRTRLRLVEGRAADDGSVAGAYSGPGALLAELDEIQASLVADGLDRSAWGEVQDLAWQVQTFGFHALDLEVRQHSEVHAATLAALGEGPATAEVPAPEPATLAVEVSNRVTVGEVLATFRAIADLQVEFGAAACHRYVISFTRGAQDVLDVLALAARVGRPAPVLDVVPLFESADALGTAGPIVEQLLAEPRYRRHLAARGDRQEVMLGYSDSTKESGTLAASWMLYQAQASLAAVAEAHDVELTIFHGRGGAIGRGGGPMSKAILSHAPGSMRGRLKLTEQGEVIAARYANPQIALRHLERLTSSVLLASSPAHEAAVREASVPGAPVMEELAATSRAAFRATVWEDPAFEAFFRAATPIEELAGLAIGSRPAARARSGDRPRVTMATLRAIPWVFSWSQSRLNLPGWFGVGSAVAGYEAAHGPAGLDRLRALYRDWSFFATVFDTVELSLAKASVEIAERYAQLAEGEASARIWARLKEEHDLAEQAVLRITGRERLLDATPELQRSIGLRNPYVDSLSELQVRLLGALRALPHGDPERRELERLVHLTVSGVAAGIQNTG